MLIFTLTYLFIVFGVYLLAAFGICAVLIVLNFFIAIWSSKWQDKVLSRKDKRMNATTEVVNNIKVVKLNSWIKYFINKVEKLRGDELYTMRISLLINSLDLFTAYFLGPALMISTFSLYFGLGNSMSVARAFAAAHVLFSLEEPVKWLPEFVGHFVEFLVSMHRIHKYLM
jgi:ABC-type bacteriocin/lantibiotic exporter with double-glycine peptidase domain